MPAPYIASLPPDLDLGAGYKIRVNAISPTDGSQITGVVVTDFAILVTNLSGGNLAYGPFQLVPGPGA